MLSGDTYRTSKSTSSIQPIDGPDGCAEIQTYTSSTEGLNVVKVFYFSGDSVCGRLRTVLYDGMHFVRLASSQAFTYLGDRFPQMNIGDPPAAVIEVLPDTQQTGWRTGFYLAAQPPLQFEETLRAVRN
jgi:hypothetical protein